MIPRIAGCVLSFFGVLGVIASCGLVFAAPDPLDWPNWRGPGQDRTSAETGLPVKWNPQGGPGSNLLWENEKLGGRSTPIILRGKLYLIKRDQPGTPVDGEKVVCADAQTGEILWEHVFNVYLSEVPDIRVGWSSCVADPETGRIYAQGVCGYFCCLDGETGEVVWERSLHEEFGVLSTYGGRTNFPLVFADTVITSAVVIGWGDTPKWGLMAKPAHRFLGFDKATGELRWLGSTRLIPYDTTYSTPTIAEVNGQMQMVFGAGDGAIWSLQPGTGRQIWKFQFSRRGINASPLVVGNTVFASHSEENWTGTAMGGLVALDASQLSPGEASDGVPVPKLLWGKREVMAGYASPVMHDGRLYVLDDGAKLRTFNPRNGQVIGRPPRMRGIAARSTPLVADGKLYVMVRDGGFFVLEPTDRGAKVLHKLNLWGESFLGSAIASHGRIYIPSTRAMYCIAAPHAKVADAGTTPRTSDQVSASVKVPAVANSSAEVAHVQVVPYDILLKPDATQQYRARLFDDQGEFLREASPGEVEFSVDGAGDVTTAGSYTSPTSAQHVAAMVTCKVGDVQGTGRIRIVPPLPWKWDFNDAEDVPLTWIGGRVRYVLRDVDGERIMVKRMELPTRPGMPPTKLGTRSRMWMGHIDLNNYTVEADVQITEEGGKTPDAGLINSRYTMVFMGENQELHLRSWDSSDFRANTILPMNIEAGVWYTMKCKVEQAKDVARVFGKIWRRGEQEPDDWTLELEDPAPNRHGSPGLYGEAGEAEIYWDNLSVTPNETS